MLDAFGTANELAELFGVTALRFEARAVAVRETVHTFHGLNLPVISVADRPSPDWSLCRCSVTRRLNLCWPLRRGQM
jgi:hypothetical protein